MSNPPRLTIVMIEYRLATAADRAGCSLLWQQVFGDEAAFVDSFFSSIPNLHSYIALADKQVVSAFHLLPCVIAEQDKCLLQGWYLYAAATAPPFRGRGLMGSLIQKAAGAERRAGADFICLYPAQESLYSYYARLGFAPKLQAAFCRENPFASAVTFSSGRAWMDLQKQYYTGAYVRFEKTVYDFWLQIPDENLAFPVRDAQGGYKVPVANALGAQTVLRPDGMLLPLSDRARQAEMPVYLDLTLA